MFSMWLRRLTRGITLAKVLLTIAFILVLFLTFGAVATYDWGNMPYYSESTLVTFVGAFLSLVIFIFLTIAIAFSFLILNRLSNER